MNRKLFFLLIIILSAFLYPQEWNRSRLDSMFYLYTGTHNYNLPNALQNLQPDSLPNKCGFRTVAEVLRHFKEFTESQQKILKKLLARPGTDSSIVSPSGFFRIHFYISGPEVPQYNVNELAEAFDSSYNFEVNYLGYPPPPPDTLGGISPADAGSDGKYDVYIVGLGTNYGETYPETEIAPGRHTTYIKVHNNFNSFFYTQGIDAARVTAAHEFHHAIQIGNYILRLDDLFFYELTSTSMEEFVFNTINDYYGYLPSYFYYPNKAFASYDGYELAAWNIFLKDKFGFDIIKSQWERMPDSRALNAINSSLFDKSTNFGNELNKFGIWTFFTNYRAIPGEYFAEAANYPVIRPFSIIPFYPPSVNVTMNAPPTSNNFVYFVNPQQSDTLAVLVTNSDYSKGIDSLQSLNPFHYFVYNYNEPGSQRLTDIYYSKLVTNQTTLWASSEIYNNYLIREGEIPTNLTNYAFPNPFRFGKNNFIYFPVKGGSGPEADLNIYTSAMEQVYSVTRPYAYISGQKVLKWNGLDNNNNRVASGVYIFITNSGYGKIIGKLVIFNE